MTLNIRGLLPFNGLLHVADFIVYKSYGTEVDFGLLLLTTYNNMLTSIIQIYFG
jgi:hypothetical protein